MPPLPVNICTSDGPLAAAIRAHQMISRLQIGDTTHKLGLYADDVIVILTNPLQSLLEQPHGTT